MFMNNLFRNNNDSPEVVRIETPPSAQGPSQADIDRWLEGAEIIDLGEPKRDQTIMPTTWHTA